MTLEELIQQSETRQCRAVFPYTFNANETLFGGLAMQWMDEVAYITATRCTRRRMFTVQTNHVKFLKAILPNTIVEVIGTVEKAEAVKLTVKVEIYAEQMYGTEREKAIEATFIFASLNEQNQPIRIAYPVDHN